MRILVRNVRWYSRGITRQGSLRIRGGRIVEAGGRLVPRRGERVVDAPGMLALPGLVNGHDHLEMDLFPRMGTPPYPDVYAWAREIHHPERTPLKEILAVPLADRLRWGGYRNLLGGATTVAHHNPYHRRVFGRRFPVRVVKRYRWAHSLGFASRVDRAWARSRGRPFVIHAMEGVSVRAAAELDRLDQLGVLAPNTILVHAVALGNGARGPAPKENGDDPVDRLAASGAAVAWCPASNRFLYGRTAPVARLQGRVRLCLGTDSTLSGAPTLLDEAREAARTGEIGPDRILEFLTTEAADVFQLRDGRGTLEPGSPADLVLIPDRGGTAGEALLETRPADLALVLVRGRPRLADPSRAEALGLEAPNARVAGRPRWLHGDPAALRKRIAKCAGAAVLQSNPVWSLLDPEAVP